MKFRAGKISCIGLIIGLFVFSSVWAGDQPSTSPLPRTLDHAWRKYESPAGQLMHRDTASQVLESGDYDFSTMLGSEGYGTTNPRVFQEIDAIHYTVDAHFFLGAAPYPDNAYLEAEATIEGQAKSEPLDEVVIDFYDNITINSFQFNGSEFTSYTRSDNKIWMDLSGDPLDPGEYFDITVDYSHVYGDEWQGLMFRKHGSSNTPAICSIDQPYDSPGWWPCFDYPAEKATADFYITCPDWMTAFSNGLLQPGYPVDNGDGTATFYWSEAYPAYTCALSVAMTDYIMWTDTYVSPIDGTTMPLIFAAFPEDIAKAMTDFAIVKDALSFYAQIYGEYPFIDEKYGMAETPNRYGSLEHQTMTSLTVTSTQRDPNWDVIVHEAAHQWWGDWVTCENWHHTWLHEGFATYSEVLFNEHYTGEPAGEFLAANYDDGLYDGALAKTPYNPNLNLPFHSTGALYDKGAWVLHMLRHIMGDSNFFTAVKAYGQAHAYANANTDDLKAAMEAQYGSSLDYFFDQWVYTPYRPIYTITYKTSPIGGGNYEIDITLHQVQDHWIQNKNGDPLRNYYIMPVDFTVHYMDSTTQTFTFLNTQRTQHFQITTAKEPDHTVFDEGINILKVAYDGTDYKYDYSDFYEMEDLLETLEIAAAAKTPPVFSLQVLGYSYQGNPIYAVKFSDNPEIEENQEPDILIDAGIHSNEWLATESNIEYISYLFDAYYNEAHTDHAEVVNLINNYEIWIIPMINPDGRIRDDLNGGDPESFWTDTTYHTDDTVGWRMNVQDVECPTMPGGTNQGIDLNRNWSYKFWELSDCESTVYSGGAPFSAPENKVLKQFINNHMISLVLHQHSNAQLMWSSSEFYGMGDYIAQEGAEVFNTDILSPLMTLWTPPPPSGKMAAASYDKKLNLYKNSVFHPALANGISPLGSGLCDGNPYSAQYFQWLFYEIDCILAPDNHSRRSIQNVMYEYPCDDTIYGHWSEGKIGQYALGDASNGFHMSSGMIDQWIIDRNIAVNKYFIEQSRYPFSPRNHEDMSRRPEAPDTDLAMVGAKISEEGDGLPGCFTYDNTNGRDVLQASTKRITWNVQNNGTGHRTINTEITICNLTDDPECSSPFSDIITATDVASDAIETFTYDYTFEPLKDYSVTLSTGESNSYENDVKRFVFSSVEPTLIVLSSFTAEPGAGRVMLRWETASETDHAGFNLYRADAADGQYTKINTELIPAKGTPTQGATYEFTDTQVRNRKTYSYKLEDVDIHGTTTMHGPVIATPKGLWRNQTQ